MLAIYLDSGETKTKCIPQIDNGSDHEENRAIPIVHMSSIFGIYVYMTRDIIFIYLFVYDAKNMPYMCRFWPTNGALRTSNSAQNRTVCALYVLEAGMIYLEVLKNDN